jgi:hypothetical protein
LDRLQRNSSQQHQEEDYLGRAQLSRARRHYLEETHSKRPQHPLYSAGTTPINNLRPVSVPRFSAAAHNNSHKLLEVLLCSEEARRTMPRRSLGSRSSSSNNSNNSSSHLFLVQLKPHLSTDNLLHLPDG